MSYQQFNLEFRFDFAEPQSDPNMLAALENAVLWRLTSKRGFEILLRNELLMLKGAPIPGLENLKLDQIVVGRRILKD